MKDRDLNTLLMQQVERQSVEIHRLRRQLQRGEMNIDLAEVWLWKENQRLNERIDKLLESVIYRGYA